MPMDAPSRMLRSLRVSPETRNIALPDMCDHVSKDLIRLGYLSQL